MTGATAEDPKKSTAYRVLVVVVSLLSILILLALAALVAGSVGLFSGHHRESGAVFTTSQLSTQLPAGAKITSIQTSGNRVVIGLHTPSGDEVDIFDTDTGRPVARIKAASSK